MRLKPSIYWSRSRIPGATGLASLGLSLRSLFSEKADPTLSLKMGWMVSNQGRCLPSIDLSPLHECARLCIHKPFISLFPRFEVYFIIIFYIVLWLRFPPFLHLLLDSPFIPLLTSHSLSLFWLYPVQFLLPVHTLLWCHPRKMANLAIDKTFFLSQKPSTVIIILGGGGASWASPSHTGMLTGVDNGRPSTSNHGCWEFEGINPVMFRRHCFT